MKCLCTNKSLNLLCLSKKTHWLSLQSYFCIFLHIQNVIYNPVFIWIGDGGAGTQLNPYQQIHLNLELFPSNSILTDPSEVKQKCQHTYKRLRKKDDKWTHQMIVENWSLAMSAISYLFKSLWEPLKVKFCFAPCCQQFLS